ncbi:hypothetical protein MN608_02205 [Microdochium nivale]|nr:hypothetical protein MN608_02205 [Microdochium nivale]
MFNQLQSKIQRTPSIVEPATSHTSNNMSVSQSTMNNFSTESFGPSVDGPPSPERIRALNKQLRRSSLRERHLSHNTVSSKSSSQLSAASEAPSWELGPEVLSRKSSQRSSSSSNPPREMSDSAISFGKGIFNRRGKGRREGSDTTTIPAMVSMNDLKSPPKDLHFMSTMFARRKGSRPDIDGAEQKKILISGPYNFQHLTHTQKASVPDLNRTSRMELVSEFAGMRAGQKPSIGSLKGIHATEIHVTDISSESLPLQGDRQVNDGAYSRPESQYQDQLVRDKELPATPGEAWFKKHSQSISQDIAKMPPPRPRRSPSEPPIPSPIPPPPRISSRGSTRFDGYESVMSTSTDTSVNGTTFLTSQPPSRLQEESSDGLRAPVGQDDGAWPLTPPAMTSVPEVPEEEERHFVSEEPQASVLGHHSSLRGSISVPLLRQLSLSRTRPRRPSNTSDTLGNFSVSLSQPNRDAAIGSPIRETFFDDDWENDIDYCYEHEAEADCDYAWERPSLDMWRHDEAGIMDGGPTFFTNTFGAPSSRNNRSSITRAVSPASPRTRPHRHVPSNASLTLPVNTNFSLPDRGHSRPLSRASSNLGSQEFTLSPSLLIPNDFQQQMLDFERGANNTDDEDDVPLGHLYSKSALMLKARQSASTTASRLSEQSLSSSRHKSTHSTSTAYTRWTAISTGSIDCWQQHADKVQDEPVMTPTVVVVGMTLPETEEPAAVDVPERRQRTSSEGNILTSICDTDKSADVQATRRRAKTTSRSHYSSPQFGLFPSVPTSP